MMPATGGDVPFEIEFELFVERCIDRVHSAAQEERVAVGGCTNNRFGSYVGASARPVFDDKWLPEPVRQPFNSPGAQ